MNVFLGNTGDMTFVDDCIEPSCWEGPPLVPSKYAIAIDDRKATASIILAAKDDSVFAVIDLDTQKTMEMIEILGKLLSIMVSANGN